MRDEDPKMEHSAGHAAGESSLAAKVVASAGGLAKSMIQPSNGSFLEQSLASSSAASSKTTSLPIRGGQSSGAASHDYSFQQSAGQPSGHSNSALASGFRSGSREGRMDEELGSFLNDGLDFREGNQSQESDMRTSLFAHHQNVDFSERSNEHHPNHAVRHSEYDDGAELRQLLSDPRHDFMGEDAMMIDDSMEDTAASLFGESLSEFDKGAVEHVKSRLPEPATHRAIPADHPLNLRLDTDAQSQSSDTSDMNRSSISEAEWEQFKSLSEVERSSFLQQWDRVLNNYTDDVWGDMLPTVEAARSQIQHVQEGTDSVDSKTLRRLRLIMGHLSETSMSSVTSGTVSSHQQPLTIHQTAMGHQVSPQSHFGSHIAAHNQRNPEIQSQQHWPTRGGGPQNQISEDDLQELVSNFHCPWRTCHQVSQESAPPKV